MKKKEESIAKISNLEALRQLVEFHLPKYKALAVGSGCAKGGKNELYVYIESWGSNWGVRHEISDEELTLENLQKLAEKLVVESVFHILMSQTQIETDEEN